VVKYEAGAIRPVNDLQTKQLHQQLTIVKSTLRCGGATDLALYFPARPVHVSAVHAITEFSTVCLQAVVRTPVS